MLRRDKCVMREENSVSSEQWSVGSNPRFWEWDRSSALSNADPATVPEAGAPVDLGGAAAPPYLV